MNPNYNYGNVNNNYAAAATPAVTAQKSDGKKIAFYILVIVAIVGCFLPYMTISAFGESASTNYVYSDGELLDGIYVIAVLVGAIITSLKKGFKPAVVLVGIGLAIAAFDFIDLQSEMDTITYGGLVDVSYGIGFYLLAAGLVGAFILCILLCKSEPAAPVVSGANVTVATNAYQQPTYNQQPAMNQQPQQFAAQMPNQYMNQQPQQPQVTPNCPYCGTPKNEGMFCKSCGGKY